MRWTKPVMPITPALPATTIDVEDAYLSPVHRRGDDLGKVISGAVYDTHRKLIPASQRIAHAGLWLQEDPAALTARDPDPRVLPGTWLYGGHWMGQFGHFLIETISNLWPSLAGVRGIVFHAFSNPRARKLPWQIEVLQAGGIELPTRIVRGRGMQIERLIVPTRPVEVGGLIRPEAITAWDRWSKLHQESDSPRAVLFSRSAFHARGGNKRRPTRTTPEWDRSVDEVFGTAGFTIVHPEKLSIPDQIRLATNAKVLAGSAGTALHLAAFAPSGTRVIEIGDARTPHSVVPLQELVNAARGHRQCHLPYVGERLSSTALETLRI